MGKKMDKRKRKHNTGKKRNAKFGVRLLLICVEVFLLVVVVGVSLVLIQADEQKQVAKRLKQAGATAELLVGTNVSDKASNHNEQEVDNSKYGRLLADTKFCEANKIYAKETISAEEVVLTFAGDVSFAEGYANMGALEQRSNRIYDCFDEFMMKEMQEADIFMINNEFPYTDRGTPTAGKTYTFRSKPENVKMLYDMGVDIVSIANNHVYDYGEVSLLDTLATLEEAAMPYAGAGRNKEEAIKPVCFIANDIKIAFVCATQIEQLDVPDTVGATENGAGVFRCWNDETIYDVIRRAKEESDFVVCYVHWGQESTEVLHWAQIEQAEEIAKAGADLIVGDHPHILQGMDCVEGVPVMYSMGNYWFNSKTIDTGLLKAVIDQNGLKSLQFVPAVQSGCITTIASGSEKTRILDHLQDMSPDITVNQEGYIFW